MKSSRLSQLVRIVPRLLLDRLNNDNKQSVTTKNLPRQTDKGRSEIVIRVVLCVVALRHVLFLPAARYEHAGLQVHFVLRKG